MRIGIKTSSSKLAYPIEISPTWRFCDLSDDIPILQQFNLIAD